MNVFETDYRPALSSAKHHAYFFGIQPKQNEQLKSAFHIYSMMRCIKDTILQVYLII